MEPFIHRSPSFQENVIKERANTSEDFVGILASPCAQTKAYVFEKNNTNMILTKLIFGYFRVVGPRMLAGS